MSPSFSIDAFSDIVSLIYAASVEPEKWGEVVCRLREVLSATHVGFNLVDLETEIAILQFSDGPSCADPDLPEAAPAWDVCAFPPVDGDIAVLSRDRTRPLASRATEGGGRPSGLVDALEMTLLRTPRRIAQLAAARHDDVGCYRPEDIAFAERLLPHLRRAAAISERLVSEAERAGLLGAAVEHMAKGIVLVDTRGRVVHANAAARLLAEKREGISLAGGSLCATDRTGRTRLDAALRSALDGASSGPVALHRPGGRSLVAHVEPLATGGATAAARRAVAAVYLCTDAATVCAADGLDGIFNLTPAEARVLRQLLSTSDIPTAARRLEVAESTVRTHVRALFEKTGVNRITDLVGLVHRLASPVRRS